MMVNVLGTVYDVGGIGHITHIDKRNIFYITTGENLRVQVNHCDVEHYSIDIERDQKLSELLK